MDNLAKYGHHPDPQIDADVEIERLRGVVVECHAAMKRALDYRAVTPEGLAIKNDIRYWLEVTGCPPEEWGRRAIF